MQRLAHRCKAGSLGIWTYKPAYFCDLSVSPPKLPTTCAGHHPRIPRGVIREWFVHGFGAVACEPSGLLNLNRFLPMSMGQARLSRRFETLSPQTVEFRCGFSDKLSLQVDDEVIFAGQNTYAGMSTRHERGYAEPGTHSVRRALQPGTHKLSAVLEVSEPFGWGLTLALRGPRIRLLPANAD